MSWSSGGRTSGVRDDINRDASMRSRSSLGRPSSTARRAPRTVSAAPCTAACALVSIEPRVAWFDITTARPRVTARRAPGRSARLTAASASTWASRIRSEGLARSAADRRSRSIRAGDPSAARTCWRDEPAAGRLRRQAELAEVGGDVDEPSSEVVRRIVLPGSSLQLERGREDRPGGSVLQREALAGVVGRLDGAVDVALGESDLGETSGVPRPVLFAVPGRRTSEPLIGSTRRRHRSGPHRRAPARGQRGAAGGTTRRSRRGSDARLARTPRWPPEDRRGASRHSPGSRPRHPHRGAGSGARPSRRRHGDDAPRRRSPRAST